MTSLYAYLPSSLVMVRLNVTLNSCFVITGCVWSDMQQWQLSTNEVWGYSSELQNMYTACKSEHFKQHLRITHYHI